MVERIPFVGRGLARWSFALRAHRSTAAFAGSAGYWEERYAGGGDSGRGSYGKDAAFKAGVLNRFVTERGVRSVIEFGCGDGNQLSLARYPRYLGLDVSPHAVDLCRERFSGDDTKEFSVLGDYSAETADLALSLDVIYHLVEDDVFDAHMRAVFAAGERFVIVFSTNMDDRRSLDRTHVRHRTFTEWVSSHASGWQLTEHLTPPRARNSRRSASFYIFVRRPG